MATDATGFVELPAADAFRHTLGADGRESLAHMLVFPERGIAGFVYPSVRANGLAKGRASLFGPGLPEPIHEEAEAQADDDMDFDDWRTGPLRMRVREAHRAVDLAWEGTRIQLTASYRAMHPAYAFSTHPLGNPPYFSDDRTEQHGQVAVNLRADGVDYELDGMMIRDHSWGPRIWGINQHYKWFHAVTEQCSVHVFEMFPFGRRQVRGYIYRDGMMGHVTDAEFDVEFDDGMVQRRIDAQVSDDRGRVVEVQATTFAFAQMHFDPKVYLNETGVSVRIDGRAGIGWVEFCWNRDYFDFARDHVSRYGRC